MLDQLNLAELELPELLSKPELWHSLFVNYEKPFVERLWCAWNGYRLNLHRILPCNVDECFFHPHPWPSAMRIIEGTYQMIVGYGSGIIMPPTAVTLNLSAGSTYEMLDIDSWHSVRPLDAPVMSVMLTGKPWNRDLPKHNTIPLFPLSDDTTEELLAYFKKKYV